MYLNLSYYKDDVSAALTKDREKMGKRCIEVFESSKDEMDREGETELYLSPTV